MAKPVWFRLRRSSDLFSTDASSSFGYGAFLQGAYISLLICRNRHWNHRRIPRSTLTIRVHEIFRPPYCLQDLAGRIVRSLFMLSCKDNQIVVSAVNKGSAKGAYGALVMQYLRDLFLAFRPPRFSPHRPVYFVNQ